MILGLITSLIPLRGQIKQEETTLKREVTLYNPYKPSLPDVRKKSYLPHIIDSLTVNPTFNYEIVTTPYSPQYTISPIKSASLLPDPLTKLYKSYVKLGFGNNNTPLAELSVTNERSKRGAAGFYAKHYSSNGKVPLENKQKIFAGFMDNDASLFGKKYFRNSTLDLSADLVHRTRYAYGYDTENMLYNPGIKDIMMNYYDIGARASYSSDNLDSTEMAYDFGISYDYFHNTKDTALNHIAFRSELANSIEGFYMGSSLELDYYELSDSLDIESKYIFSVAPYVKKRTGEWSFDLGLVLLLDKNLDNSPEFHYYPDVNFGFNIVPEYMKFFAKLGGKLEKNDPLSIIEKNPYLVRDGTLFRLPNTSHKIIISAGLNGNNGIGGNYLASFSYSLINDLLLFSNIVFPDTASRIERGNYFIPVTCNRTELITIHGELTGMISDKIDFRASGNFYKYSFPRDDSEVEKHAWNKPDWDMKLRLNYNLRDKIIAGIELTALGKRKLMVNKSTSGWMSLNPVIIDMPEHVNLSLNAEYRYTRILSFWAKINNISDKRYYEWAFYPSQMFNFLVGFTYSL